MKILLQNVLYVQYPIAKPNDLAISNCKYKMEGVIYKNGGFYNDKNHDTEKISINGNLNQGKNKIFKGYATALNLAITIFPN